MNKKITKKTTLSEILQHTETLDVLKEYEVPCLSCAMMRFEMENLNIGDIAEQYNINIDGLLKGLNKAIEDKKK